MATLTEGQKTALTNLEEAVKNVVENQETFLNTLRRSDRIAENPNSELGYHRGLVEGKGTYFNR